MKSFLIALVTLFAALSAQGLTRFAGPQGSTIQIDRPAYAYGAINPSNSEWSGGAVWVKAGNYKVTHVYSPYVQHSKGWSWIEGFKKNADGTWSTDQDSIGYQGMASLAEPNKRETVITGAAIFPNEKVTFTGFWPQWVGIEIDGKTYEFFYGNGTAGAKLQ